MCLILLRNRNGINNPIPSGDAFDPLGIVFKIAQCNDEMVFERIDTVEYPVVEMFFLEFVPEVFLRIKFGRVWRQEQQSQIVWQEKTLAFVPSSTITTLSFG